MPEQFADWRQMLHEYLQVRGREARERLAEESDISERTLYRWAQGGTPEDPKKLEGLARAMHGVQDQMLIAVRRAFPKSFALEGRMDVSFSSGSLVLPSIELYYYVRALEARAVMVPQSSYSTIYREVLRQLVRQLDRDQKGMLVVLAQCVTPEPGKKVRRLKVHPRGYGTDAWRLNQIRKEFSVGAASLTGTAVATGRPAFWPSDMITVATRLHIPHYELVKSSAAFPILYAGKVAGALFIASTIQDFFSPSRVDLITHYVNIFALAFESHEFYSLDEIDLFYNIPSDDHQNEYYEAYNDFVNDLADQYPDASSEEIGQMAHEIVQEKFDLLKKQS